MSTIEANVTLDQPRTRWAAIVWGMLFAAVSIGGLWTLSDDDRRRATSDWAAALTPPMITTLVLLIVGALVLVAGAVGLIRHTQRRTHRGRDTASAEAHPAEDQPVSPASLS